MVYSVKRQWRPSVTEDETAIALDPNNARAHAHAGFRKMFLGRSEEGLAEVETAFRLSPRDPEAVFGWEYYMCVLHNRLAHWDQAIPWCEKSIVAAPQDYYYPYVELVAANAWAGHDKETRDAAAQLRKVNPYFAVQTGRACTGATIRPSTRKISASSRACARRACRRAKRSRIECVEDGRRLDKAEVR